MIPIQDLTDVTLAIEDTDEDDEEDLTDVTLVSDDWSIYLSERVFINTQKSSLESLNQVRNK